MSRRLVELFRAVTWAEVEAELRRDYPEYQYQLEDLREIFGEISTLEPVADAEGGELWVMLTERVESLGWGGERQRRYVDVDGTDGRPEAEGEGPRQIGLDFVPWAEWLGMRILEETRAAFSEAQILAHCLMEMSFHGGDEEAIRAELRALEEAYGEGLGESRPGEDVLCELASELGLTGPDSNLDRDREAGEDPGAEGMRSMRRALAVYSDLHGDIEALRSALARAEQLGCEAHLCLGDFLDEARPAQEVVELLMERKVRCIRGNHERWLLAALGEGRYVHPLSKESRGFLEGLGSSASLEVGGVGIAMHHARPGSDMDGLGPEDLSMADIRGLLAEAGCDVLLVGHSHRALVATHPSGGLVANPGALGRPPFVPPLYDSQMACDASFPGAEPEDDSCGDWGVPSAVLTIPDEDAEWRRGGTFGVLFLPERRFEVIALSGDCLVRSGGRPWAAT